MAVREVWKVYEHGDPTRPIAIQPWQPDPDRPNAMPVLHMLGMGVESVYTYLRWCFDPSSRVINGRRFEMRDLILVTAMTGNEKGVTGRIMRDFILPIIRSQGTRYIQIARMGHTKNNGISLLDDSSAPTRMFMSGTYTLEEHLEETGSVAQAAAGKRRCSTKFKGEILDGIAELLVGQRRYLHTIGYNVDEGSRVARDNAVRQKRYPAMKKRSGASEEWVVNLERNPRIAGFPMFDQGVTREDAKMYILDKLGPLPTKDGLMPKSACVGCPFAHHLAKNADLENDDEIIYEWLENPDYVLRTLAIEARSLSLNPRQSFWPNRRLIDYLRGDLMFAKTMKMWDERVATATEYGLYRVRQISGKDYRAIERIKHADGKPFLGTRREMEIALIDYAHGNNLGGRLDRSDSEGVHRWVVRERPEKLSKRAQALAMQKDGRDRFDPRLFEAAGTEDGIPSEAYVVAIEGALDKSRGSFEKHWVAALGNSGGQTQSGFDLLADDGELIDEPKPTPISARELSPDEGVFSEEPVDFRNHTALALFDL